MKNSLNHINRFKTKKFKFFGSECPRCKSTEPRQSMPPKHQDLRCNKCNYSESIFKDTLLYRSRRPIRLWFRVYGSIRKYDKKMGGELLYHIWGMTERDRTSFYNHLAKNILTYEENKKLLSKFSTQEHKPILKKQFRKIVSQILDNSLQRQKLCLMTKS